MNGKPEHIGFIGVGLMGHGIAQTILAAGYPVSVIAHTDRSPVEDLVTRGATEAMTLKELASKSSIIHICAPGSPEVEAIIEAILPTLQPGTIIVDCSTSDPKSTIMLAAKLKECD